MISIKYNNIDLTNTPNLILAGYEGLDIPTSETISISNPNLRGTRYQRSSIQERQISFTFYVFDVEATRQMLMNSFKSGEKGTLYLSNEYRSGKIECYLEEMIFDKFTNPTTCQIMLKAPYPYFKGIDDIIAELTNVSDSEFHLTAYFDTEGFILGEDLDEYTATVINLGDIPVGAKIEITAFSTVVNPVIYNVTTNKKIELNYTMSNGEKITITTNVGNKKIISSIKGNIINKLTRNSTFFDIQRGTNKLSFNAKSGISDMKAFIIYNNEYGAI